MTNLKLYANITGPENFIVTLIQKEVRVMKKILLLICAASFLLLLTGCITDPDVGVTSDGYYQFDVGVFTFFYNPNRCCAIEGIEYCGYKFNLGPYETAIYCPRDGSSIVEILLYDYHWEKRLPKIVGFGAPGLKKYKEVYPQGEQLRFRYSIDGCWSNYEYRTLK
ncbi:MAG: hypothetical protein ABIE03_01425 [Patescibacteria group bacterium]